MGKKILRLRLDDLRDDELLRLFRGVEDVIDKTFGECSPELGTDFQARLNTFEQTLNQMDDSRLEELREADAAADKIWLGLFYELMAGMKSPNDERREAAMEVNQTFARISNPTDLPYAEEYLRLKQLMQMMDVLPVELLKKARVDDWLEEMHKKYAHFMAVHDAYEQATTGKDYDTVKEARKSLISSYRLMCITLEVVVPLRNNSRYDSLIDNINETLRELTGTVMQAPHRSGKTELDLLLKPHEIEMLEDDGIGLDF